MRAVVRQFRFAGFLLRPGRHDCCDENLPPSDTPDDQTTTTTANARDVVMGGR